MVTKGERWKRYKLGGINRYALLHVTEQQGLTVQHKKLYSISYKNL